jgi:hypothetical protein
VLGRGCEFESHHSQKHINLIQNIIVKIDSAMGMVMGSGWRVIPIILKNVLLFFGGFLRFFNLVLGAPNPDANFSMCAGIKSHIYDD